MNAMKKLWTWVVDLFRINKEAAPDNPIWFLLALSTASIALVIACIADWQNGGEICPIYRAGVFVGTRIVREPVLWEIRPDVQTFFWSCMICLILHLKKCIRLPRNLLFSILYFLDVLLVASLIRSFLPAESVELFRFLGIKKLTVMVNPQQLIWVVALFSLLSMRSISGLSLFILIFAFWSRMSQLNLELGNYGVIYLLCAFSTFVFQVRIASLTTGNGWLQTFLQDIGRAGVGEISRDIEAVRATVAKGVEKVVA